jgi:hypothetical protein
MMGIDKNHTNYSKDPALKGKVISVASGPNRASRRPGHYRNLPKQMHLVGRQQVAMMMGERRPLKV